MGKVNNRVFYEGFITCELWLLINHTTIRLHLGISSTEYFSGPALYFGPLYLAEFYLEPYLSKNLEKTLPPEPVKLILTCFRQSR